MTSIFELALGSDFARLHPELQRRFGFASADETACTGSGVMDEVWRGPAYTVPFLALGAQRNVLFPERGRGIPFTIENYAYLDSFGRETVTFNRAFEVARGRRRRFDATMVYNAERGTIVDYLGTHQHVAVDLELRVDDRGGLRIRTARQRIRERALDLRLPESLSAIAELHEWYDERLSRFRIEVRVANPRFGPVFGYRGTFTATYSQAATAPASARPLREDARC